jgi:putative spermidine/putrescine transport system ATP-binding protein
VTIVAAAFEQATRCYGTVLAVDHLDLEIRDGEFFTFLGPSGSGKTTCLRMLAGFEQPDSGRVLLAGVDVTGVPPYQRDVNTVFQDYALFPHLTVEENVGYGLMIRRVPIEERKRRVAESLERVRLASYGARKPSQLSGGQRQRVAMARALINRPRLLLLDEPLGALDLKLRQELQVELKQLQREVGITFAYVTHDQEEALSMSDRLAVFRDGRIEQVGAPSEVYEHPATEFVAGFVGTSNILRDASAERLLGKSGAYALRPEKIVLREAGATPPPNCRAFAGRIVHAVYLGLSTRYVVELDGGITLSAVTQNAGDERDAQDAAGRTVTAMLDPANARPLAR